MSESDQPRLSHRARAVLQVAHELARRKPGFEPHSGHLLIALLRAGGPLIEDTAQQVGLDYEAAIEAVHALAASAIGYPDPPLAALVRDAQQAAERQGQVYVSAGDLLSAAIGPEENIAARAVRRLGIDHTAVDRALGASRDMLVPLLALPDPAPAIARASAGGVRVRRARAWEVPSLQAFIAVQRFSPLWAPEATNAFARQPISVFLAERGGTIAGFAAYDCGLRGIFGPTGVAVAERSAGVASALLLRALADMRAIGYAYAIIGAVGPAEFYERVCGAVLLPSAWPSYVESCE